MNYTMLNTGAFFSKIVSFLEDMINEMVNEIFSVVEVFFNDINWIVNSNEITNILYVMVAISFSLLTFMGIKQLISVYVLETAGDPDSSPLSHLVKIFFAMALITSHPFIFNQIMNIVDSVYDVVLNNAVVNNLDAGTLIINAIITRLTGGLFQILMIIVYAVIFVMLLFKGLKRAIELALLKVLFPLFCVDLVTAGGERFKTYFASYFTIAFGFIIQLLLLRISINMVIIGGDQVEAGYSMYYAIALVLFSLKSPEWLEKYTYSSGVGAKTSSIARSAGQVGVQLLRLAK